jgi:hypothetical protein
MNRLTRPVPKVVPFQVYDYVYAYLCGHVTTEAPIVERFTVALEHVTLLVRMLQTLGVHDHTTSEDDIFNVYFNVYLDATKWNGDMVTVSAQTGLVTVIIAC